ncbi:LexA family transcriptional regulator [Hydrogenimonas sp.]
MDNVAKRLDEACRLGGFSNRREMAEALGISYNTLNDWIRRGVLTEKGAIKIASKIPISQTYLLTGEGDPEKRFHDVFKAEGPKSYDDAIEELHKKFGKKTPTPSSGEIVQVPKLSAKASAGGGTNIESVDLFDTGETIFVDRSLFKTPLKNILAIQVDGYSMVPVLLPDSWVFFTETSEWSGDGLYVLIFRNVLMVKQVEADPKTGNLWIKSANPDYDSWQYDPTEDQSTMKIVGRVVRCVL